MWFLLVPALISFSIKWFFLLASRDSLKSGNFTTLLAVCALHSLCEVFTFGSFLLGADAELLFRFYYVALTWWVTYSFIYASEASRTFSSIIHNIAISISIIITLLFVFSDIIISGYYYNGYSLTAHKEQGYWIFQIHALVFIFTSLGILAKEAFFTKTTPESKTQSFFVFWALLTPFLSLAALIITMQMGYKVNALMIIPVTTAIFFLLIIKSEPEHDLTDFKRFIPFSPENRFARKMNRLAIDSFKEKTGIKDSTSEFQKLLLEYQKNKGCNKHQAAKNLGISQSTFYSKLSALEVEWKDKRKN